jgi:hypothetical protein
MSEYFKNTAFNVGFWFGICLFIFLNYISYVSSYNKYIESQHGEIRLSLGHYFGGFPFPFYHEQIGNPNFSEFYWTVVFVDILIGLFFSFILGLIFKLAWSKIATKN